MKLTKKEQERIKGWYGRLINVDKGFMDGVDTLVFDKILTSDYVSLYKPPKYFPIETAPINQRLLLWDSRNMCWTDLCFFDEEHKRYIIAVMSFITHWRPMPKGPKNV